MPGRRRETLPLLPPGGAARHCPHLGWLHLPPLTLSDPPSKFYNFIWDSVDYIVSVRERNTKMKNSLQPCWLPALSDSEHYSHQLLKWWWWNRKRSAGNQILYTQYFSYFSIFWPVRGRNVAGGVGAGCRQPCGRDSLSWPLLLTYLTNPLSLFRSEIIFATFLYCRQGIRFIYNRFTVASDLFNCLFSNCLAR